MTNLVARQCYPGRPRIVFRGLEGGGSARVYLTRAAGHGAGNSPGHARCRTVWCRAGVDPAGSGPGNDTRSIRTAMGAYVVSFTIDEQRVRVGGLACYGRYLGGEGVSAGEATGAIRRFISRYSFRVGRGRAGLCGPCPGFAWLLYTGPYSGRGIGKGSRGHRREPRGSGGTGGGPGPGFGWVPAHLFRKPGDQVSRPERSPDVSGSGGCTLEDGAAGGVARNRRLRP